MTEYVYYTDDYYPGMQWRYPRTTREVFAGEEVTVVSNTGDVRLDGGGWQFATTTLADHINDRVNKEVPK